MTLTQELKSLLQSRGADLVGAGNMEGVQGCAYKTGVAVAVALPRQIVLDLQSAPTKEYYEAYHSLNQKLNRIVLAGEDFLKSRGFAACAQTTDRVRIDGQKRTALPHKTVATRAGLGWIGKNCLLVTPQYGPAVRLSSLLTDAPLECGEAVTGARCGACRRCVEQCPAGALAGVLWEPGLPREAIVDIEKCRKKQIEIMKEQTGIETDLCGKCFAVCTYTQNYLNGLSGQCASH